jgi:OmcA/MtrC family decaheme c-type cytochrome
MEVALRIGKIFFAFLILCSLAIGLTIAGDGIQPTYKPSEKAYYLTASQASFVRPGLKLEIQGVAFDPPNVNVTFKLSDDAGQPLDRLGIQTPGTVVMQFILGRIRPGDTQYSAYTTRVFTSTPDGHAVTLPWSDNPEGTYTDLGNGVYKYTLNQKLPANFDVNSTTTMGVQAARDLTSFGLIKYVANATLDFVPNGTSAVTQVRDVVRIENCNQCHDPLALHGGNRRDTKLCILCHQPQNTDPPTGNSLDFKVYIHKIHMGAFLPSVTGKPLNILGTSGSGTGTTYTGATPGPMEEDFKPVTAYKLGNGDLSTVVWPQDVRNCTTCHQKGSQSDNWKTNPSRAACGSCHDDVDFSTGKNHSTGGVQVDDSKCSTCHPADSGLEFDLSVAGVHTIPTNSKKLAGLNVEITGVTGTNPGDKPTVSFKASDGKGNPVDATKLTSLSFALAGPTTDYTFVTRNATGSPSTESALTTVKPTTTGFTYTFTTALPTNAEGSFAVEAEASRTVTIPGSLLGQSFSVTDYAFNPVFYFGVGGAEVTSRRTVVDVNNCNVCHKTLAIHGGGRRNNNICVFCHNPSNVDDPNGSRKAGFNVPDGTVPQSINFRFMIHRVHRGEDLSRDFTIYRSRGVFGFNGLRFPGDLRDCAKCHVNKSNQLPLPDGLANALAPREFYSPLGPTASACLGCHDGEDAAAHTYVMTAPFGESCPVCHEEGADFAVSKVHAR